MTPDALARPGHAPDITSRSCVPECGTLAGLIELRAREAPSGPIFTDISDRGGDGAGLSASALFERASACAAALQARAKPGSAILLVFPNELDFVVWFMACQLAGMIAVPAAAPRNRNGLAHLAALSKAADARITIVSTRLAPVFRRFCDEGDVSGLAPVASASALEADGAAASLHRHPASPDDVAVLQFTSGSTGVPKGVMVSHRNLLSNCAALRSVCGEGDAMRMIAWLPFFHDWGLVGCLLFPFYAGSRVWFLDPTDFLRRPMRWIEAVAEHGATVSCAPDFAYAMCAAAAESAAGRRRLDLSAWRLAMVGAEPVRPATLSRFAAAFERDGFRARALYPSYGLAEATLIVTGGAPGRGPVVRRFDSAALEAGQVRPAASPGDARALVGCGKPLGGQSVRIVDPAGRALPDGVVGEIEVAGPCVTTGYYARPSDTRDAFVEDPHAGHGGLRLRTGDLGFVDAGELFVCGRCKDVIIKAGANHFAEDIEHVAAAAHLALRPTCGAAFGIDADGQERLVLVHEVHYGRVPDLKTVVADIQRAIAREAHTFADAILIVRPGTLEKTSSGKIRRQHTRALFLAGALDPIEQWRNW